jgi:hypothetical protein
MLRAPSHPARHRRGVLPSWRSGSNAANRLYQTTGAANQVSGVLDVVSVTMKKFDLRHAHHGADLSGQPLFCGSEAMYQKSSPPRVPVVDQISPDFMKDFETNGQPTGRRSTWKSIETKLSRVMGNSYYQLASSESDFAESATILALAPPGPFKLHRWSMCPSWPPQFSKSEYRPGRPCIMCLGSKSKGKHLACLFFILLCCNICACFSSSVSTASFSSTHTSAEIDTRTEYHELIRIYCTKSN